MSFIFDVRAIFFPGFNPSIGLVGFQEFRIVFSTTCRYFVLSDRVRLLAASPLGNLAVSGFFVSAQPPRLSFTPAFECTRRPQPSAAPGCDGVRRLADPTRTASRSSFHGCDGVYCVALPSISWREGMVKTWELLNEFQVEGFGQSTFGSTQADPTHVVQLASLLQLRLA